MANDNNEFIYTREYWTGDSRDGMLMNGEGYHFFRMHSQKGLILEAYEVYESDDGEEIVTPLPEMHNVSWIDDLGFDDLEVLDQVDAEEFVRIKSLIEHKKNNVFKLENRG